MPSARLTPQMIEFVEVLIWNGKYRDLNELTAAGIHRLLERQGRADKRSDGSYERLSGYGRATLDGKGYGLYLRKYGMWSKPGPGECTAVASAEEDEYKRESEPPPGLGLVPEGEDRSRAITLDEDLTRFLNHDIASGTYEDFGDLVRAAIRELMNETGAADFYLLKARMTKSLKGPTIRIDSAELRALLHGSMSAEELWKRHGGEIEET